MDSLELLKNYKELLESGILSQEEFDEKKKQILDDINKETKTNEESEIAPEEAQDPAEPNETEEVETAPERGHEEVTGEPEISDKRGGS